MKTNTVMPEEYGKSAKGLGKNRFMELPAVHLLIIVLMALAVYSNTFHVPFLFDDSTSITKNPITQDLNYFLANRHGYDDHPNRFIGYLTFALNYHWWGGDVVGYHVFNLAIHIANALLVFLFVRFTLRTPFFITRGSTASHPSPVTIYLPFFTALLFVCHPIQTQAVTYIVQRLTSLATLFYLAAIVCHIRWRLVDTEGAAFRSLRVLPFYLLSLLAAVLAMKTKEISFTLPLMVILFECSFFGRPDRRLGLLLLPLLSSMLIIPLTMINISKPTATILSDVSTATNAAISFSRWEYLCTQFSVIVTYIRLLLLPVHQNLDYDYQISHSLLEPRSFFSFLLLIALLGLAAWFWRKSAGTGKIDTGITTRSQFSLPIPELRLISFGIFWFFLALLVESSIVPIQDVIVEHRAYLPSVGFFLALTALFLVGARILEARKRNMAQGVVVLLGLSAIIFGGATFARNHVWRDTVSFWEDVKAKSPLKPGSYTNLGAYYARERRVDDAIREFEAALRLDPVNLPALYNLGQMYLLKGRQRDAEQVYITLRKLDPETFKMLDAMYGK